MGVQRPDAVRCGPFVYRILFTENEHLPADEFGMTDHDAQLITVDGSLSFEMELESVFHEVFHCIFQALGLDWELGEKREERYVRMLSPAVLDVLRRNPMFACYLLGEREQPVSYGV